MGGNLCNINNYGSMVDYLHISMGAKCGTLVRITLTIKGIFIPKKFSVGAYARPEVAPPLNSTIII